MGACQFVVWKAREPWCLDPAITLTSFASCSAEVLTIEAGGATKVGIGAATGNDGVYIVGEDVDIERIGLQPHFQRDDIEDGVIKDARRFITINDVRVMTEARLPGGSPQARRVSNATRDRSRSAMWRTNTQEAGSARSIESTRHSALSRSSSSLTSRSLNALVQMMKATSTRTN